VTRVAAMDGPAGAVHLLLGHGSAATSILSLSLDAPPEAVGAGFTFYGESGEAEAPGRGPRPVEAFGHAIDELLTEIESGARDQQCDVRFGRDVVAVLAAAETARTEGRTVSPALR
jgi:hypothetical protein